MPPIVPAVVVGGGYGHEAYGIDAYGSIPIVQPTTFGVSCVEILDVGRLQVCFTQAVVVNRDLYEPSNFVITVRFGRASTLFVKRVIPNNEIAATEVILELKNGIVTRGRYRLRVRNLVSVFNVLIDANDEED